MSELTSKKQPAASARMAFSIGEFAARNGLSAGFTRGQIRDGKLQALRAGRRVLITAEAEQAWLKSLPCYEPVE